ncbi:MAG: hypothetical protein ACOX83_10715 [Candidatus Spyradocola sp.]|jgi:hypothetical protein
MTRSEVKACLFAWSIAARRLNALNRRLQRLSDTLSALPAPPVLAPIETNFETRNGERVGVILPRGNQTSDPTAVAADRRADLQHEIEAQNRSMAILTDFYFNVLRAMTGALTQEQAMILYGYYANPYPHARDAFIRSYPCSERMFYHRLREAVTTLQRADSLPDIPDDLRKEG